MSARKFDWLDALRVRVAAIEHRHSRGVCPPVGNHYKTPTLAFRAANLASRDDVLESVYGHSFQFRRPMIAPESSHSDDVEHLLRNAQLRDELEPLLDESIDCVNARVMSTRSENEFLESMLAWERAPMLPISQWFEPELVLPDPSDLTTAELSLLLAEVIDKLYSMRIVLDFTNHLSDYQLYTLIYRDILPSYEKKLDRASSYLHWDCANAEGDPEKWLRYYASVEERRMWAEETDGDLPPRETPPFRRKLPEAPL